MRVLVVQKSGFWLLVFKNRDQVSRSYTFKRLLQAIEQASILQLHISNIEALPLTQYLNQGAQNV